MYILTYFLQILRPESLVHFDRKKIIIEKQKEVWFNLIMVSVLSLTNESLIKLDLYSPNIKERRMKEENVLKHAKIIFL